MLRAFAILKDKATSTPLRLLIVGGGEEKDSLVALASSLGIASDTTFVGSVKEDEVPKYLNTMDIFVALSRSESFGVAVLEASACGLPVVVSDVGGLTEVVSHGVTGYVVKDGDPVLAADALCQLVTHGDEAKAFGNAGRSFVMDRYSWDTTTLAMESLYRRMCQS